MIKKKMDSIGRIVIPIELRKALHFNDNEVLIMEARGNELVIKKQNSLCSLCKNNEAFIMIEEGQYICKSCLEKIEGLKHG